MEPISEKAEVVTGNAAFWQGFRDRRCLIPAGGFYEWATRDGRKAAYHIRPADGGLFAFAGLWDVWSGPGRPPVHTCAVITVHANGSVRPFHDRMPAILQPDQFGPWLDTATPADTLHATLCPAPDGLLTAEPVGPAVNNVANDGPACLEPAV